MIASEIPQELVDILDDAAGKKHSRSGPVLTTLAKILTRHEEMVRKGGVSVELREVVEFTRELRRVGRAIMAGDLRPEGYDECVARGEALTRRLDGGES
jgi:hypothetical protein